MVQPLQRVRGLRSKICISGCCDPHTGQSSKTLTQQGKAEKLQRKVTPSGPLAKPNPKDIFMVSIRAHYRGEEQLQELRDVLSRKTSHSLGQTVLVGEKQLLSKAE